MGSNPTLSATLFASFTAGKSLGEVTEWSKVHDWKSCVPKGTAGSNPALSAIYSKRYPACVANMVSSTGVALSGNELSCDMSTPRPFRADAFAFDLR